MMRAGGAPGGREPDAARRLLEHPRYEVLPLDGIEERVLAHVPRDVTVTVTASPAKGLDPTLEVTERLAAHGYRVVPHLSARQVRDHAHVEEIVARLDAAGVRDVFVPAGDAKEPGPFPDAASLLRALAGRFAEVGITGYPESHHLIDDEDTIQAMFEKAPMASYIVSQICFDPEVIETWIARVRARGTHLPIWIGMPGVVDSARLLRVSAKIGLGQSARFLRAQRSRLLRLAAGRFTPDGLLQELSAESMAGLHLFTFNELEKTERWRREALARLRAA
jgi:methylenetetrahydrofolate reductase (NADPH)